jgi:hypothetical protein
MRANKMNLRVKILGYNKHHSQQYFSVVEQKEKDEFVNEMFVFVCGVRYGCTSQGMLAEVL